MKTHLHALLRPMLFTTIAVAASLFGGNSAQAELNALPADVTRVAVVFSGGHDTEGVDHGRPVVLIAAALGVKPEVFREAFSHVHPAGPGSGGPTDAEARQNKSALMNALGKYGITNERLNEVSNFYRYASWNGGIWKNTPATANALVKNGNIKVPAPKVDLSFGKDMQSNGAVSAITAP
jgi:hypothetical protein